MIKQSIALPGADMAQSFHRPTTRRHRIVKQNRYKEIVMNLHLTMEPLLSLLAGVLILAMPRLLNYIVAIYLIVLGVSGLVR